MKVFRKLIIVPSFQSPFQFSTIKKPTAAPSSNTNPTTKAPSNPQAVKKPALPVQDAKANHSNTNNLNQPNIPESNIWKIGRPGSTLQMGIVGMANIGQSSTFNLISKQSVPAQNFPFCTIDPNLAVVTVPDARFKYLVDLFKPAKQIPAALSITDIAGLVKGASEGHGLGNEFLSHIASTDGIYQVVRAFSGDNILHTEGVMDPLRDMEIIRDELILKDAQWVDKRLGEVSTKAARGNDAELKLTVTVLQRVKQLLQQKQWIRYCQWKDNEIEILNKNLILSLKPVLYLINLSKEDYLSKNCQYLQDIEKWISSNVRDASYILYSVEYEQEIQGQPELRETSQIDNIIMSGYSILDLQHFFTVGSDEVRCWTVRKNSKAPEAAARIHTDFQKFFANAEVVSFTDFQKLGAQGPDKLKNVFKQQGQEYLVQDGDIIHFQNKNVQK